MKNTDDWTAHPGFPILGANKWGEEDMRGAIAIFLMLSLAAVQSHATGRSSAYHRLRDQFARAYVPQADDLYVGQLWHCSGSLKAAKGLFRYVDYWLAYYRFEVEMSEGQKRFKNFGPRGTKSFTYGEKGLSGTIDHCQSCSPGQEFIRVTDEQDLVVELAYPRGTAARHGDKDQTFQTSVSDSQLEAQFYLICENPDSHNDPEWYHREGEYWSQ